MKIIERRAYYRAKYKESRIAAILRLGGKCVNCGITDIRVLEVNHLGGVVGKARKAIRNWRAWYQNIADGETKSLEVRCANCNVLYEYEVGRRVA